MDIQSNNNAASLFDGLGQSQQTQGTQGAGAKNDLFSKMMDRMLADAAARKREQAADAARDSANEAKEARDARAADAQRKAPVRAEPKPELGRDTRAQAARRNDADAEPARTQEPKAAKTDGDREVQAGQDDRKPVKSDKPKDAAKAGGAEAKTSKSDAAKSDAAKSGTETAGTDQAQAGDGTDAAVADAETAQTDIDAAMAEGGGTGDAPTEDAGAEEQIADQPLTVTAEAELQQPVPQPSDLILAGLTAPGQSAAGADSDAAVAAAGAVAGGATAGTVDPAAQLAAQLAQAQATAGTPGAAQAGADAAAKNAADALAVDGDGTRQAQAAALTGVDGGPQSGEDAAEALPDDDAALPDRFADLLAAAKAKSGEAKQGGKQTGADGGSRNDSQSQAMPQPAAVAPAVPPVAETVAASTAAKAAGALEGLEGAGAIAGSAHAAGGVHTHPALAAMEGMHGSIPGIDQPQATATLRPSRGSAGMPMGVHDQIAVHIKKQVADEVDQFTINLHPAELGRIDIKLDIGADGRVSAMVAVERAQTLELLQRDSRGLERALQEAGLQTDSNSLNFSLRGEGNPFGNDGRGDGKGNGAGRRGRGLDGSGDQDASDTAVYTATLGNGRLDIRA